MCYRSVNRPSVKGSPRVKYRRHDLHGLLIVDKPLGISSMDVVRQVRRAAGHCKTGHAGTLDPLATGVMVCCLGHATKAVDQLMGLTKVYDTVIDLSAFSTTDDAEGERTAVAVTASPTADAVQHACEQLIGDIAQTPPAYSAIKIDGQRAYKLARAGQDVTMKSRTVRIDAITVNQYDWPTLNITVTCGKGTYIRSLARQIGNLLNTGGYLTALRRTAIGPYTIDLAVPLEGLTEATIVEQLLPTPS